jgi:TonB family protein
MQHSGILRFPALIVLALLGLATLPAAESKNPVAKTRGAPTYPYDMRRQKISGSVTVEFIVGTEGRIVAAQVVESTHPGFNSNALAAVRGWVFEPGMKEGKKINVRARQIITFDLPKRRPMPPFAEAKKRGSATMAYWLDENKRLVRTEVLKASSPACGKAAAAVVADECAYDPKMMGGKPGRYEGSYAFGRARENLGKFADEILNKLNDPKAIFHAASELDKPLELIVQDPVVFPPSLHETHTAGSATLEFVIDPEGLVQWPRVIEATHEDFGYAAAQTVGQWVYQIPEHNGKPTSVRIRQTVEFSSQTQ